MAVAVLVILTVAALVGVTVLHLFGVSLYAFMVAAGGVLAWLGFLRQLTLVDLRSHPHGRGMAILIKAARGEPPGIDLTPPRELPYERRPRKSPAL